MTDQPNPSPCEVTQEDRDAAAFIMQSEHYARQVQAGKHDTGMAVQAFARHRIAALSTRPLPQPGEGAREILADACKTPNGSLANHIRSGGNPAIDTAIALRAIERAQASSPLREALEDLVEMFTAYGAAIGEGGKSRAKTMEIAFDHFVGDTGCIDAWEAACAALASSPLMPTNEVREALTPKKAGIVRRMRAAVEKASSPGKRAERVLVGVKHLRQVVEIAERALAPSPPITAVGGQGAHFEALALELAEKWNEADEELDGVCGTTPWDKTAADYLEEARDHIRRCASTISTPSADYARGIEDAADIASRTQGGDASAKAIRRKLAPLPEGGE